MNLSQEVKRNSFFTNSLFIFFIRFFPSLAYLLVTVLYARRLNSDLYGAYQNFWIQANVFSALACFGIHVFIVTYSPSFIIKLAKGIKPLQYVSYSIWLLLACGVFAWLQCKALETTFIVPFTYLLIYALTLILEAYLLVFKNFRLLNSVNITYAIVFCSIHWFVLTGSFSLHFLFVYLLLLSVVRLLIYMGLARQLTRQHRETLTGQEPNVSSVRSLWLHLGLYDVLQILSAWIDKFIISLVLIAPISAIYYTGSINVPFLPLILTAASSATLIQLSSTGKEDETAHILKLVDQTARILSCIVFPLFLFLFCYRYELFIVVFTSKYIVAVPIFMMSILVLPLKAYSFSTVLQKKHKGAVINKGAIMEIILACLLMYPLYKWLGLPGVALSFVITTYLQASYYLYHTAKTLSVGMMELLPIANWVKKLIVFAILFIAIHYSTTLYFTSRIVLFWGCGVTAIVVLLSLLAEVKALKRKYVNHAS